MKKKLKTPLMIVGVVVLLVLGLIGFKFYDMMQQGVNIITGEVVGDLADQIEANKSAPNLELDYTEMFSEKDLVQIPDMEGSIDLDLVDNEDYVITEEGTYVVSGNYNEVMIIVEVDEKADVLLVLDEVSITNESKPAVYVKSGDKVLVTTTDTENEMIVTGSYSPDGATNLDAVVFSKSDIVFNGIGSLEINSVSGNGISTKDDLKITGGTIVVDALEDGLEANDSIRIYDGDITINSENDALHTVNDDDDSLGYVYIQGGTLKITASDDAIRGNSGIIVDGGEINILSCAEGLEASQIIINDGLVDIYSTDDGINATFKTSYRAVVEINGGVINIDMASGDTDGIDSNGDFTMNGGEVNVDGGMAAFDVDGDIVFNAGNVNVDGVAQTEIVTQQIGIGAMFNK